MSNQPSPQSPGMDETAGSGSSPLEFLPAPESRRRRQRWGGAPNTKGGSEVTRQNFSMHPTRMVAIIDASNELGRERAQEIVDNRARRVTYSKIVAALAWLLKTRYMTPEGRITDALRRLVADYEASLYERPDDARDADAIMEARRLYAAQLPTQQDAIDNDYLDRDEDAEEGEV